MQYDLFGHVLRCTFIVQEQFSGGFICYCARCCDLVMSVVTVLYKRMSIGLG